MTINFSEESFMNPFVTKHDGKKLIISRDGAEFLTIPFSVSINGETDSLSVESDDGKNIVLSGNGSVMTCTVNDDCIIFGYKKQFSERTAIYNVKAFAQGVALSGFDRAFCPQPRRNDMRNLSYYNNLPDISMNGYFTAPALEFAIGSAQGWASFGLLDLPDTFKCRLEDDYSFLVEACGGNKVTDENNVYTMPRVVVYFPDGEIESIKEFRSLLIKYTDFTPKQKPKLSEVPEWWKNPLICIYGDQLNEDIVGQGITKEWVDGLVKQAEDTWGIKNMTLLIDDNWQKPHAMDPLADESRFPNFREYIDSLHERGHHVILWQAPLFETLSNGYKTRAQKLGVISENHLDSAYFKNFPDTYSIDYTHDNAREFIKQYCQKIFGSGEGEYNADGIKLDFLGCLRDPELTQTYSHPEKGVGLRELLHFFEMFYEEAKKVKPDVVINSSVGDPRFEHTVDLNRLHDTHSGVEEKEMRAAISLAGCPTTLIDSDGAFMFLSWIKRHYINAAIYSIPSNYYTGDHTEATINPDRSFCFGKYSDRRGLADNEKKAIGTLLQMQKLRPDGIAERYKDIDWILRDGDKVNGVTVNAETVVYFPTEKGGKGYIYSLADEAVIVPLFGHKVSGLTPDARRGLFYVDYARDRMIVQLVPGKLYEFVGEDDGASIDELFKKAQFAKRDGAVDYVN